MAIDEKEVAPFQATAEAIEAAGVKHDEERARVRALAEPLTRQVSAAIHADDFRRAIELYGEIAALYREAGLHGEADTYVARAKDCADVVRRKKWAAKRRGGIGR
jgi:hypothetical protein